MDLFRGYKSDFDDAAAEAEENINAIHGLTGGTLDAFADVLRREIDVLIESGM